MKNYFCIENLAFKQINILEIIGKNIEYSFDTVNWVALNKQELKFHKRKLYLRSTSVSRINCKTYFNVSGNIMSLIYGDKFTGDETKFNGNSACFYRLFANSYYSTSYLLDASNLILPVTTLTDRCYAGMFYNCTSLIKAPQLLPATTLAEYCYSNMFRDCTSLTTTPKLPSTTLADYCYNGMFEGCTSLTEAPQLLAITLAKGCYSRMFAICTSLKSVPQLPATKLAKGCYTGMFYDCTSLETAPELPATTLAESCYAYMFDNCTSLKSAPQLPATTLANHCYFSMFEGCTSLTEAPELHATTLANHCYSSMFNGCTSLNNITITINTTQLWDKHNTLNWLENVSTHGIIYNKGKVKDIPLNSNSGCPYGWTIKEID